MSAQAQLAALYAQLESECNQLPLVSVPTDIIPGEGNPQAEVLLIGEAPGLNEHIQRRPFVGRSGQLLRQTLTEVGLPPDQVYISNIVKARPEDNRDPSPAEILAYKPYLDQEIEIISPKLIVTLGRFSMAKFLPEVKISQVHGRLHKVQWKGKVQFVLPMYHPAAGLRSSTVKQAFVADFAKIAKTLDWVKQQHQLGKLEVQIKEALL